MEPVRRAWDLQNPLDLCSFQCAFWPGRETVSQANRIMRNRAALHFSEHYTPVKTLVNVERWGVIDKRTLRQRLQSFRWS